MRGQTGARTREALSPRQPASGPIDLDHLSRQTLGDSGLELEVLRLFDDMSRTYYGRVEASTTVQDLLTHLHTLKGAASGIGAFGLAEIARAAEIELREGGPVSPERIDDLGIAVSEVSAFIAKRLEAAAD